MINRTFYHNGFTFERISKKAARTAYKNGLTLVICPENLHPFNPWNGDYTINRKSREQFVIPGDDISITNDFNGLIASFEYYNCVNSETGFYTAFYIPIKEIDAYTGEEVSNTTENTIKSYDYDYMNRKRA